MKRRLLHGIHAADVMTELGSLDKLNADCDNLSYLMKAGRERADSWLQKNFGRLGEESTVDIGDEHL
jgi:NTE family protein